MKNRFIFILATVVILLVSIFGFSGCQTITLENDQETVELLQNVFGEAGHYLYDEEAEIYTVYDTNKTEIGYAFYAEGMGEGIPEAEGLVKYAGPVVILVGLRDTETINSIFVISHSETIMFWSLMIMHEYFAEFEGLKIEDAYFERVGGQVDGRTGATLSSLLVLNTVRKTALEKVVFIEGGLTN